MLNSKLIKITGLIAIVTMGSIFVGGCASRGNKSVADSGSRSNEVCTFQPALGTHIGSRRCTSRSSYEANQTAEHKQVEKNASMNSGVGGGF